MYKSYAFCGYLKLLFLEHIWMWRIENIICQLCLAININRGCSFATQKFTEDLPSSVRKLQKTNVIHMNLYIILQFYTAGFFHCYILSYPKVHRHSTFIKYLNRFHLAAFANFIHIIFSFKIRSAHQIFLKQ